MKQRTNWLATLALLAAAALLLKGQTATAPLPAEPPVAAANRAVLTQLPFADRQDFEDARRGFIATSAEGHTPDQYRFLQGEAPPTVNPSLWRQAQLNAIDGLFQVADGVYQVRGFSMSNLTIVEGATGIILIDTIFTVPEAKAALALYRAHRPGGGSKPVVAIVYTHSHADHYGGVKGVITEEEVAARKVRIIAPAGFLQATIQESVTVGNTMSRRALFQFGMPLPRGDRGNVDAGLGKDYATLRITSLIAPNEIISQPVETKTIDGVEMVFQLAPASEAPAEMHVYLPKSKVLDMAENVTHNLHNLLPLRGTEVRDSKGWSRYISEALERFGADADVLIAQHHWPVFGNARLRERLENHRDLYKYVHDQTVRMMNLGYKPAEIAEALSYPPGLENDWSTRGYYGTLSHNSRAVYQKYIGWYDGNPANLNTLPPVDDAKKYVEYMGGASAVIARANQDFKAGNYRWVAQVMDQVVFAEPTNKEARALAAKAFEQLGYLAESATWRNAYLLAAQEMRAGASPARPTPGVSPDLLRAMPFELVFEHIATRVNGPRAGAAKSVINWRFTDTGETGVSTLSHGVLTVIAGGKSKPEAGAATVAMPRRVFEALVLRQRTVEDVLAKGEAAITGGSDAGMRRLFASLDAFDSAFPVVEPRQPQ